MRLCCSSRFTISKYFAYYSWSYSRDPSLALLLFDSDMLLEAEEQRGGGRKGGGKQKGGKLGHFSGEPID